MRLKDVITRLKALSNLENKERMARFGIKADTALGITIYTLRSFAKEVGKDHELAKQLWDSGFHEAKILTSMVGEPKKVTEDLMENWVKDFDSWDVCDQVCSNLFDRTSFAYKKAIKWSTRSEEFVKRAGFVLIATLSVHDKTAEDQKFTQFFSIITKEAMDNRNFVKKAVNWALRQIGKRNLLLNDKAIKIAQEIQKINTKSSRWIASDALRELTSEKVQMRLKKKKRMNLASQS
jgi:3-methyladenine DNA glycosylase AlkD